MLSLLFSGFLFDSVVKQSFNLSGLECLTTPLTPLPTTRTIWKDRLFFHLDRMLTGSTSQLGIHNGSTPRIESKPRRVSAIYWNKKGNAERNQALWPGNLVQPEPQQMIALIEQQN